MTATYFNAAQRREALLKWLRRQYGDSFFNTSEAHEAVDIFTPLYGGTNSMRQCGRDLSLLKKEGHAKREGSQWALIPTCPSSYGCTNDATEEHTCPYREEIVEDESTCQCCADCTGECALEI